LPFVEAFVSERGFTRVTAIPLLVAFGVVLGALDRLVCPGVWFRLGLANAATLLALQLFGARAALAVAGSRILILSLVTGTFLAPGFWLSAGGGLAAAAAMLVAWRIPGLGFLGVSLLGAFAHVAGQMVVLRIVLPGAAVATLWPLLAGLSLATGAAVGWLAAFLSARLSARGFQR
jgi:heptaprenyl diphosphate synthase